MYIIPSPKTALSLTAVQGNQCTCLFIVFSAGIYGNCIEETAYPFIPSTDKTLIPYLCPSYHCTVAEQGSIGLTIVRSIPSTVHLILRTIAGPSGSHPFQIANGLE